MVMTASAARDELVGEGLGELPGEIDAPLVHGRHHGRVDLVTGVAAGRADMERAKVWRVTGSMGASRNGMGLPGRPQGLEVVADQGLADAELIGEVGDAQLLAGQELHDPPAQRIARSGAVAETVVSGQARR
jgi:hypothetical protein